jgi:hypothetical protein
MTPWRGLLALAALAPLAVVGCTSPEATRQRGGGPGADVGNRGAVVQMHEGSRPYHGTPRLVEGGQTDLAPASQARQAGRRP